MLKTSKVRGFTLVELMVTLAVLAVIIGIAVPKMSTFIKKQAVRSTADEMVLSLVYARSEALKSNSDIYVLPSPDGWTSGWRVCEDGGCSELLRSFTPSGKSLLFTGFSAQIKLNHKGMRATGGEDFTIADPALPDSEKRCIKLHKTGRAAITSC